MNEIIYQKSYKEYKAELDGVLQRTAEGFVQIGYLLKVARDTNILEESGYKSVAEFAQAEYGIDKTQVSRFIHINDKFSEGGYSDHLMQQYQGFGYAKLTLMLQLPDAVNESLSPEYSKSEIQAIKEEVDEEKKITDIEVMLEQTDAAVDEDMIHKLVRQLGSDEPNLYVQMHKILADDNWTIEDIKEVMAPQGETTYSVRIPGTGRIMLMLNTESEEVQAVNIRTGEKESYGWGQLPPAWQEIIDTEKDAEEKWSQIYCKEFPKVAPVQPEEPKKETKVKKAPKQTQLNDIEKTIPEVQEKPQEPPEEPPKEVEEPEQQLPGQMSVEDMPEVMPEPEEHEEQDRKNQLRGYKAAVTQNIETLKSLWQGEKGDKIERMLNIIKDLQWRLEQLQKEEEQ